MPKTLNALPMSHKPTDRELISGNDEEELLLSLPLPACCSVADTASLAALMVLAAVEGKGTALLWSVVVTVAVVLVFVELVLDDRLTAASCKALRRVLVFGSDKEEAEERHLRHMKFDATAVPGRTSGRKTAAAAAALRRAGSLSDIPGDSRQGRGVVAVGEWYYSEAEARRRAKREDEAAVADHQCLRGMCLRFLRG